MDRAFRVSWCTECIRLANSVYFNMGFAVLQFQHTVQETTEDSIEMKQEYMLLAVISHKGDTPNCGRYSN
jgi:hypothetical protein